MKIILAGYPGSKKIIPISSYLLSKYTQNHFTIYYLNYGNYEGKIYNAKYVMLDHVQKGGSGKWGFYLKKYLKSIDDKYVILALDDFLICSYVDYDYIYKSIKYFLDNYEFLCLKLNTTPILSRPNDVLNLNSLDNFFLLKDNAQYRINTQYCLWNRKKLINLIDRYEGMFSFFKPKLDPWNFELKLDKKLDLNDKIYCAYKPIFKYYEGSALSNRNVNKICVNGLKKDDIDYFINNNYLNFSELILSHLSKKNLNIPYTEDDQFFEKIDTSLDSEVLSFVKNCRILYSIR
jgi:hypothetical protein